MGDNKTVILDVRTPSEYQSGHALNSVNIDFYAPNFVDEIQTLDKTQKYQLYCRSGNRSGQAEVMMKQMGFKDVHNVGGLTEATQMFSFEDAD